MLRNRHYLATVLLIGLCVTSVATTTGQSTAVSPGRILRETVQVCAGGPYHAKAGVPIVLRGTYTVAGQTQTSNQLRLIGQALRMYAADHGSWPPAAYLNKRGEPTVSWRVLILPYLGEKDLYDRFDLNRPWDDWVNRRLLNRMPAVYRNNGTDGDDSDDDTTETGFAGVQGYGSLFQNASADLNGGRGLKGISVTETLAAGPVGRDVHLPWTAPGDIDIEEAAALGSRDGFAGRGDGFTPLLFLDGTVHLMPNDVGVPSMKAWTHIQDPSTAKTRCVCAIPTSVDAGLRAMWDLKGKGTSNTQGWDVTFQASEPGRYEVTLHAVDRFGGTYSSSAIVEVH